MAGPINRRGQQLRPVPAGVSADQLALARGAFRRAFDAGQTPVFDKFKRRLEGGQYVLLHLREDLIWEVVSVEPDLSENAQPGVLHVRVRCEIPVAYVVGSVASDMIIVGKNDVTGKAVIQGPGDVVSEMGPVPTGAPSDNGASSPAEVQVAEEPPANVVMPPAAEAKDADHDGE